MFWVDGYMLNLDLGAFKQVDKDVKSYHVVTQDLYVSTVFNVYFNEKGKISKGQVGILGWQMCGK